MIRGGAESDNVSILLGQLGIRMGGKLSSYHILYIKIKSRYKKPYLKKSIK